jgi:glyoxylase-like metal-dependent hydrolase (beta-lactamase superfamily II)
MEFAEDPPPRFVPLDAAPGVRRMVAPNPGPMTQHGTNTWLVDGADGLTVIDPGPDDAAHVAAVAAAGPVARILLTHTHPDHLGGAAALRAATGAPIHGWGRPWARDFMPDVALEDGARVAGLTALHTPGHASDHLSFAQDGTGVVFTGDHVMAWSTSVISPPDGDMGAYMASLRRLQGRGDTLYLCGHGPPVNNPESFVRALLMHRASREAAILAALARGPATPEGLVAEMYGGLDARLAGAAKRSVLAHLLKLESEERAWLDGENWVRK